MGIEDFSDAQIAAEFSKRFHAVRVEALSVRWAGLFITTDDDFFVEHQGEIGCSLRPTFADAAVLMKRLAEGT